MNMLVDLSPQITGEPLAIKYNVRIHTEIGGPECYVDLIQLLDTATENDVFNIHIATPGGDLDGALAIIHAINRTQALVVGHAEAIVASAGTIIFLACHRWTVNEFASFMFHDGSTVSAGKFNETKKQIEAVTNLYNAIAKKLYGPFFTEDEIAKIMDGSDKYVTSEEMIERIDKAYPAPEQNRAETLAQQLLLEED